MSRMSGRVRLEVVRLPGDRLDAFMEEDFCCQHHEIAPGGTRIGLGVRYTSPRGSYLSGGTAYIGRPADPGWAQPKSGYLLLNASTRMVRTMLLTSAWDLARDLGYARLIGCTGPGTCAGEGPCPWHPAEAECGCVEHHGPCVQIGERPKPRRRAHRQAQRRTGFQLTRSLWATRVTQPGGDRR